jgi:iron complex outermembrane receptor protein
MSKLLMSTTAVGALLACGPVWAQGVQSADQVSEVVVTGSRYRAVQEISAKQAADVIVDSVSADDIGAVPDFNIPDALRRIPGVNTDFDEDEGRFVNIRGIKGDLNVVTLDGVSLPSSGDFGGAGRAVDLEFLPSTSVSRMQVYKSFAPNLDGSAIGGVINLVSRSAFDRKVPGFIGRFTVSDYQTKMPFGSKTPMRGEVTVTRRFGDKDQFGLVLTGLYGVRPRNQVKYFHVGGFETFPNIVPADRFNTSLYDNDQKRYGGNGKLEYKTDDTYAFVSTYWYRQQESESRHVNNLTLRAQDIVETSPTTGRASQAVNNITYDYFPITTSGKGVQFYLDRRIGEHGQLNATYGSGQQRFDHETPALAFQSPRRTELGFDFDTSDRIQTRTAVNNLSYLTNPANYTANLARWRDLMTVEQVDDAKLNYGWNVDKGDRGFGLRVGAQNRKLERKRDNEQFDLPAAERAKLKLADFLSPETFDAPYEPEDFIFLDKVKVRQAISRATTVRDPAASTSGDFLYEETVRSAYVMGQYANDRLRLNGGLRYEHTEFSAGAVTQSQAVNGKSGDWLPSVNLRYDLTSGFVLRGGWSRSLGRPNPGDLAVTTVVTQAAADAPVDVIVSRGNPDLKPRRAENLDLSLEYYLGGVDGLLSVAVFDKTIDGDIFNLRTRGDYQGQSAEFRQNINASGSKVHGVELSANLPRLKFLPGIWSGLGFSANATFIEGEMDIPAQGTGNDLNLVTRHLDYRLGQPKRIFNTAVFYNRGGFEGRVAYNRTGAYYTSLTQKEDTFSQVDASLRYRVSAHAIASFEVRNLLGNDREQLSDVDDFNMLFGETQIDRSFHLGLTLKY